MDETHIVNHILNKHFYKDNTNISIEDILYSYSIACNNYLAISIKQSQKFKYNVPIELLIDFLNINCFYTKVDTQDTQDTSGNLQSGCEGYYLFNKESYKRAILNGSLPCFLRIIKDFYFDSKKFYVDKCINYTKFLTIIRQLCTFLHIHFDKVTTYFRSENQMSYKVYC